jgi:S1-C subfamily serine protease
MSAIGHWRARAFACVVSCFALAASSEANAGAQVQFQKNGWTVQSVHSNEGQFQGCGATAEPMSPSYGGWRSSGWRIGILHGADLSWQVVIMRVKRPFKSGMVYNVSLAVDGATVFRGQTRVMPGGMAVLAPALSEDVVDALRRGSRLTYTTGRGSLTLSLIGSADAIDAAQMCVANNTQRRGREPEVGSFEQRSGSGFFVSADGHVLTNAHVAVGCKELTVGQPKSQLVPAQLVNYDPRNDLALLATSQRPPHWANIRTAVRTGEQIAVYGFPYRDILSEDGNFVVGNISALEGLKGNRQFLQISAPVQMGNSGGPLMDMMGNVVGVVVAKLNPVRNLNPQNVNFAVKGQVALGFLKANLVSYAEASELDTPLTTSDLADHAKNFSVSILCTK